MQEASSEKQILLVGNPNVGKSTLFNRLCHRTQKTGNYAGVTVASHAGKYEYKGRTVEVIDLPGSYSLYPNSEDEVVFSKFLLENRETYCGVIYILEALSVKRGLLLFRQIQDLGIPLILVINQMDQAERRGIFIDTKILADTLGVKVLQTNAKKGTGTDEIREAVFLNEFKAATTISFDVPLERKALVELLTAGSREKNPYKTWLSLASEHDAWRITESHCITAEEIKNIAPKRLQTQETIRRYQDIDKIVSSTLFKKQQFKELLTEKLDRILVHNLWGYVVFAAVLLVIFQSVFFLAEYPMNFIENGFLWLSDFLRQQLPAGPVNSLLADGIVPGIGGIMVFAPQIGILLYFLYLLEDSGYMARVVFLMDRFLRPFGLNGKSIVPLVSGTACAIPAVLSTRNIENLKERLLTILVTPFMTCSARLPVYSIIIGLIISDKTFLGISHKALMLLLMYILGFVMALLASLLLKNFIKTNEKSYLVMDLPAYKMPLFAYDFKLVLGKVKEFITGAGKIIFLVSIIIWVFSFFGPGSRPGKVVQADVKLENSYLAKMGHTIEPAIQPLGYDWKMGVGILTSFVAREVFVGTMSTLYSLSDNAPDTKVIDKMRKDMKPNGEKVFSFATGLSILIFYAFAMQCISTVAVVYRETKSLKWTLGQLIGMSGLAYIASLLVYQIFK